MKEYVPNEKYRNMFGVQRQGYGTERVDLYLAQLEVAFKKIREDNRSLKRELAGREGGAVLLPSDDSAAAQQQELYIVQLQQQLAAEQEQSRRLHEQLAHASTVPTPAATDSSELHRQLQAAHQEIEYLRHQLNQQANQQTSENNGSYEQDMHCIAKTLVDARRQADDTLHKAEQDARRLAAEITGKAEQDAEATLQSARHRVEELHTERDRVFGQLQSISNSVRNVLRDAEPPAPVDYRLRDQNLSRQAR
ncbi:MAG: hypothetical protein FWD06_05980 [Oscillospiraceae bacterium]|nr:hypothetical protein [Oscillospiraceae bacterium]